MAADVLPGELEAWRAFDVHGIGEVLRLFSVTSSSPKGVGRVWPTAGYFEATCSRRHRDDEGVPGEKCTCGIYSLVSWEEVVAQSYATVGGRVVGRIAIAGRIATGDKGFRAERARVVELFVPFERWRWARPLSMGYGVPVRLAHVQRPASAVALP